MDSNQSTELKALRDNLRRYENRDLSLLGVASRLRMAGDISNAILIESIIYGYTALGGEEQ